MKYILTKKGEKISVDDEDFDKLNGQWWFTCPKGYARGTIQISFKNRKQIKMHRFIMGVHLSSPEMYVDHIDGNKLNNCRSNLRLCSNGQNIMNSRIRESGQVKYKGVCTSKSKGYRARITAYGKCISLGNFETPEAAAIAYNNAAIKHHGNFAYLNKINHEKT